MLQGKKILLGITGSIAAYKSILLVRLLVKAGAEVKVIMTPAAKDFAPVLTLSTLSKNPVLTDLFDEQSWSNHVMLGRWADLMIIAPLSCNSLAKMANGQCDNLLLAVYLSATCPVAVAPAMDEDMWHHLATKQNLIQLEKFGNHIIPVNSGELASGLIGEGRMAEPEAIAEWISAFFNQQTSLKGKKALVTAGPTYEHIDPVRFMGNHSSGKMGIALAEELNRRGASVTLVLGPVNVQSSLPGINIVHVLSAEEMYQACDACFDSVDLAIMAAAVADYAPVNKADEKIKKKEDQLTITLQKTRDILKSMGERKKSGQVLVGFALETNNEAANAREKLLSKKADMIVLNSLKDAGAGFGTDTNKITIFDKSGKQFDFDMKSKKAVAADIINSLSSIYYV